MLSLTEFFYALQAGLFAATLTILIRPGHVFGFYRTWLEKKSIMGWPDHITKPLGLCNACFCGQVGFWFGVFLEGISFKILLFASISILINETREWLQK